MSQKIESKLSVYSFTSRETTNCDERGISGLICQSCESMATCVRINNNWIAIPVEACNTDDGFYCNLDYKGCSNETGPCRPLGHEENFPCTAEGVFPDPYDCQKYHLCFFEGNTLVAANINCGSDKAFSAASGDCSLNTSNVVCKRRQYTCNRAGDSASWPGNLNIFYVCMAKLDNGNRVIFPTLYRCASGEVFNGRDCVARGDFTGSINPIGGPFECTRVGLHEDPFNCRSYYYCDSKLRSMKYTCPSNSHYDAIRRTCVRGAC